MRMRVTPGILLITVGVIMLAVNQLESGAAAVPAAVGAVFLVAYASTREYGLLIPGCIVSGLGVGILVEVSGAAGRSGAPVLLGLSAGFLTIAIVDRLVEPGRDGGWWPLIPGSVLGLIGLFLVLDSIHLIGYLARWWPITLILAGIWVLLESRRTPAKLDEDPE